MQFNDSQGLFSNQELGELPSFQGKRSSISETVSYPIYPFTSRAKLRDAHREAAGTIAGVTAFLPAQHAVEISVVFARDEMHLFYSPSEAGVEDHQRSVPELTYDPHLKNPYLLGFLSASNRDAHH